VHGARDQLLARAALAGDQHRRIRRRDAYDARQDIADRGRPSDDVVEAVALAKLGRDHAHLARQPALFDRLLGLEQQLLLAERLL